MDRRKFLQILVAAPVVAAVPIALAAPESMHWREVQQHTLNDDPLPIRPEFSTQLLMSDLREITEYLVNEDALYLRHDVCFTLNARGKRMQYNCTQRLQAGDSLEMLSFQREIALNRMQTVFNRLKRIRANLVPLKVPSGTHVFSADQIIRGAR